MIASWMVYTLALSALLALMAAGFERMGVSLRRPVRFVWVASMLASLLVPPTLAARRALVRESAAVQVMPFVIDVQRATTITATAGGSNLSARLDAVLLGAWCLATAWLVARLIAVTQSVRRKTISWHRRSIDGVDVHLAPDAGPAVVGVRSMHVVLPEWILDLDQPLRAIILRHEEEHRAARDPYLLFGAAIAVALMPWNIALWWQARRLRLAIEMDCDARVLAAHPIPERYGLLLLTIAQRRSMMPSMLAPMLSEPASHLERRIVAMRRTKFVRLSVGAGAGLAMLALGFACTLRSPDSVTGPHGMPQRATAPVRVYDTTTFKEFQVEQQVEPVAGNSAPRYPDSLRAANVEGEVVAQFVVDTTGRADMSTFKVVKSSHPMFSTAVSSSLPNMQFAPAQVGGKKVKQLLQMPFVFSLSKDATTPPPPPAANQSGVRVLQPVVTSATSDNAKPSPEPSERPVRQVQSQPGGVQARPGNPAPRYPAELRAAGIQGEVVAQFVVNREGAAEVESFKVLKASDPQFVDAVKAVLPQMRFYPAQVDGQPVKQLTQMSFEFNLVKP
jgi:TonB family protein